MSIGITRGLGRAAGASWAVGIATTVVVGGAAAQPARAHQVAVTPAASPAAASRDVTIGADALPRHLLLARGASLTVTGDGLVCPDSSTLVVKSGAQVVATGTIDHGHWTATWLVPVTDTQSFFSLSWQVLVPGNPTVLLGKCAVDVYASDPLRLAEPHPGARLGDGSPLRVTWAAPGGADTTIDRFVVLLDGQETPVRLGADGQGTFDAAGVVPGQHEMVVRGLIAGGAGALTTPPVPVVVEPGITLAPAGGSAVMDLRPAGPGASPPAGSGVMLLRLGQAAYLKRTARRIVVRLDGKAAAVLAAPPFDVATLDLSRRAAGPATVTAILETADGAAYSSAPLTLTVLRDVAAEVHNWWGKYFPPSAATTDAVEERAYQQAISGASNGLNGTAAAAARKLCAAAAARHQARLEALRGAPNSLPAGLNDDQEVALRRLTEATCVCEEVAARAWTDEGVRWVIPEAGAGDPDLYAARATLEATRRGALSQRLGSARAALRSEENRLQAPLKGLIEPSGT